MMKPAHAPQAAVRVPIGVRAAASDPGGASGAFGHLLKIESEARRSATKRELDALLANEGRILLRARQVFVFEINGSRITLVAASGGAVLDRASPIVHWLESMMIQIQRDAGFSKPVEYELPGYASPDDPLTRDYPFRSALCQPHWSADGHATAATLYLRESPWLAADRQISARLAETFGHARRALSRTPGVSRRSSSRWKRLGLAAVAVSALGLVPVPISVLAPLEIAARSADVVAMPIEGIVQKVLVKPNMPVTAGTPLLQLVDTVQRNKAMLAEQEVAVAAARVEKATSLAFTDPRGRQELGIARAELALKQAEYSFAKEVLAQTKIKAESDGVTVFSDPRDYEGKPFGLGERLMLIARPGEAELKISLPAADSIVLQPGLRVRAFLDADPLNVVSAVVSFVDYQVRIDEAQTAVYTVTARLLDDSRDLKFGSRGTAQILGERAPLFLYVFRRPLAALRQRFGL